MTRMSTRFPYLQDAVSEAIATYSERGFPGTIVDTDDPADIFFAPIQGDPNRKIWKKRHHAWGPIGFMLYSLSHYGLALSAKLRLHQVGETTTDLISIPAQFLKPTIVQAIRRGRLHLIAKQRTGLNGCP